MHALRLDLATMATCRHIRFGDAYIILNQFSTLGKVVVDPMISHIDEGVCIGCQACIGLCHYGAIKFDELRKISVINEAVCRGCGSCPGDKYMNWADKHEFFKIPGDTLMFHMTRMLHMSALCVGCGQCSSACPPSRLDFSMKGLGGGLWFPAPC